MRNEEWKAGITYLHHLYFSIKSHRWKQIIYIYVKTVAPYVLSAATAGIGFAWKSGIAAELIGVVRGTIGASLHTARIFLQTADLFAWTITIVLLSYAMERAFALIFRRVIKWQSN